jgi:hypothetical protein
MLIKQEWNENYLSIFHPTHQTSIAEYPDAVG